MLLFLVILVARIMLAWLAGQSIAFLGACWYLPEASWPHAWESRNTCKGRILRRINFWVVLLAWITSRIRCSALAPRPSAGFALVSGIAALLAFVVALIFHAAFPPLDCLAILCSWLSVLLLPRNGWSRARRKAKESE